MFVESTNPVKSPPTTNGSGQVGPYNQDDALVRATALPEVRDELTRLVAEGGTDDEIHRALIQWPSIFRAGTDHGNPWQVNGGSRPGFRYDTDTLQSTEKYRKPTLEGDALIAAVRRVLHIRKPKPTAADGKRNPDPQAGSRQGGDAMTDRQSQIVELESAISASAANIRTGPAASGKPITAWASPT